MSARYYGALEIVVVRVGTFRMAVARHRSIEPVERLLLHDEHLFKLNQGRVTKEAWRLIPNHYNDGGLSGASLDRPALQQLLADIRAGKITIVVYKVDRLTCSLAKADNCRL